jgi:hypothetical protein
LAITSASSTQQVTCWAKLAMIAGISELQAEVPRNLLQGPPPNFRRDLQRQQLGAAGLLLSLQIDYYTQQ